MFYSNVDTPKAGLSLALAIGLSLALAIGHTLRNNHKCIHKLFALIKVISLLIDKKLIEGYSTLI